MNLVEQMKKAALMAMESTKPLEIQFGTVKSVNPLQISVDQRLTIGEELMVLYENVRDVAYDCPVQIKLPFYENGVSGTRVESMIAKITIPNALKHGETVVMYRQQGGQLFHVVCRCAKEIAERGIPAWSEASENLTAVL